MNTENKNTQIQAYDIFQNLPNLHGAKILPIDLTSEYWTPENEGEFKLCFFQEIKVSTYADESTGETIELPCIIFLEQTETGELKTFRNGSKRLVASIESALKAQRILPGTPLRLEFLGKQKNSTNAFRSDRWSVKPLFVQDNDSKLREINELFDAKEDKIPAQDHEHIVRIIEDKEIESFDKVLKILREL